MAGEGEEGRYAQTVYTDVEYVRVIVLSRGCALVRLRNIGKERHCHEL